MCKTAILVLIGIITAFALIGIGIYKYMEFDESIVRHGTIKISKVTVTWNLVLGCNITTMIDYSGEELVFWGDLTSKLSAGKTYEISYKPSYVKALLTSYFVLTNWKELPEGTEIG